MKLKIYKKCKCGCGNIVKLENRYINGHNFKNKDKKLSEETKLKIRLANIGKKHTKETKLKISESMKGKKHTKETKKKMSLASKDKKKSEEHKRKLSLAKQNISKETREKMSLAQIGKKLSKEHKEKISLANKGENHFNWKGGISCEPYCEMWIDKEYKKSIKERDNYKCQNPDCWVTSDRLCGHHINYNKKNCNPWNVITLCFSCNSRANFNKEYWREFYQEIIIKKYGYQNQISQ